MITGYQLETVGFAGNNYAVAIPTTSPRNAPKRYDFTRLTAKEFFTRKPVVANFFHAFKAAKSIDSWSLSSTQRVSALSQLAGQFMFFAERYPILLWIVFFAQKTWFWTVLAVYQGTTHTNDSLAA